MTTSRTLSIASAAALVVLAAGASSPFQASQSAPELDPSKLRQVAVVDARYQSYNVEMAEVIGARFWKPYPRAGTAQPSPTPSKPEGRATQIGVDPDMFAARPPADLGNARLRALAAALGPAVMRVSGTWANSVYFHDSDEPAPAAPPAGFQGVLTRAQWKGVVDFAKAVDAKIVTSLAVSAGVRDFDHRVEVVFPVERPEHIKYLRDHVFAAYQRDNTRARLMQHDGTYVRVKPKEKDEKLDIQDWLMTRQYKKQD